ncbi:hypothetical protein STRTUCAR8_03674 [Streptomyces turgidiscabies Car8]|uniref:Uncharacterized protein n=1 Tax=Streptomyces turgidiscabies (strain Car8) TaxID=698760 RepID=L7ER75_STRT8|nr:hypothetical protein STRTUCAR8_03674 [Streptomyces turgidiscabies Car8]
MPKINWTLPVVDAVSVGHGASLRIAAPQQSAYLVQQLMSSVEEGKVVLFGTVHYLPQLPPQPPQDL